MKKIKEYRKALKNIATKDCIVEFSDFTDYVPINVLLYEDVEMLSDALDELEQYLNNPPLTWEDLKEMVGKPIWDNERKLWRILYSLGICREIKTVGFDTYYQANNEIFKENRFYLKEVKE